MGRKPLPANLARSIKLGVMITPEEFDALETARERLGYVTVSDFVRDAIAEAIKRSGKKPARR